MNPTANRRPYLLVAALALGAAGPLAGCGGAGAQTSSAPASGSGGTTPSPPASTVANTVLITAGPGPSRANPYTDGAFVSATICVPGSDSQCVTVDNLLVDTGSSGLRILASALGGLPLLNATVNGAALGDCIQYVDLSYTWGPVATADVRMAGEMASAVPIQIIAEPDTNFPAVPLSCSNGGAPANTVDSLSANGILGVSFYLQDCGSACVPGSRSNPGMYYTCANGSCQITSVALQNQLPNPVAAFASDNNGVSITLPALAELGAPSVEGTLTFGIGTQGDNALGGAAVQTPNANGEFITQYKGASYSASYIDSGSNAYYFLDSTTADLPACVQSPGYYCPPVTQSLSATNVGANGQSRAVTFRVTNADGLPLSNWVFDDIGGSSSFGGSSSGLPRLYFDWGLPFFFGRTVFVAIEGRTTSGGTGPYWAY